MNVTPLQGQKIHNQNKERTNQAKIINLSEQYKNGIYTDSEICEHILNSQTSQFNTSSRHTIYAWFSIISGKNNGEPESIEQLQEKIVADFAQYLPANYDITSGNASQYFAEIKNPDTTIVLDDDGQQYDLTAIRQKWKDTQIAALFSPQIINSNKKDIPAFNLKYDDLKKNSTRYGYNSGDKPCHTIIHRDGFYMINSKNADHLGWKLHISIQDRKNIKQSFNLIAPIIAEYDLNFKVIDIDSEPSQIEPEQPKRAVDHAQFTIYLENDSTPAITTEKLKSLLEEATTLLQNNKIKASQIPNSDTALAVSSYFSLRNDKFVLISKNDSYYSYEQEFRTKSEYIPAKIVGNNYNPANLDNPFSNLLNNSNIKPFDIYQHFSLFNISTDSDSNSFLAAAMFSMSAYINEHTKFATLDDEEKVAFTNDCAASPDLDDKYFKNTGISAEIKSAVRFAGLFTLWTRNEESLQNSRFVFLYPFNNSFRDMLLTLESYCQVYPAKENESNSYLYKPAVTFQEYVREQNMAAAQKEINDKYSSLTTEVAKKQLLLSYIKSNNDYLAYAALNKLNYDEEFIKILENNKDIPVIKTLLCKIYFESDNPKSGLTLYKEIVQSNLQTKLLFMEVELCQHLLLQQYLELEELTLAGSIPAKFAMAIILGRDLHTTLYIQHVNSPINHQLAQKYLSECIQTGHDEELLKLANRLLTIIVQNNLHTRTSILENTNHLQEYLEFYTYTDLQQLILAGSTYAKLILTMLLCRDLHPQSSDINLHTDVPINHQLAKEYIAECIQLTLNEKLLTELNELSTKIIQHEQKNLLAIWAGVLMICSDSFDESYNNLKEQASADSEKAVLAMAAILARDCYPESTLDKHANSPIDHKLAKEYLSKYMELVKDKPLLDNFFKQSVHNNLNKLMSIL